MKTLITSLILLSAIVSFSQNSLNYTDTDRDFNITSKRFELIKWVGLDRSSKKEEVSSNVKRTGKTITVISRGNTTTFHMISATFKAPDMTLFVCTQNTKFTLVEGLYFSYTTNGDVDTEYLYEGLVE